MTVRDLKENFKVFKRDGVFHLYDKSPGSGSRNVYKYLASATKNGSSFILDGFKPTTKLERFMSNMDEKIKSYEYDSGYYDPFFREGYFEEMIIHDYLCDKLLFEIDNKYNSFSFYKLKSNNIYNLDEGGMVLSFNGLDAFNDLKEEVSIGLSFPDSPYSWVSVTVKRNVEDIKKGIDSLLRPYFLHKTADNLIKSERLETEEQVDILIKSLSGLEIREKSIKEELKGRLQEMIDNM